MRGYRIQRENKRLDSFEQLNVELSNIPLYQKCIGERFFFGAMPASEADAFLTQYVLHRYGRYNLNRVLLEHIGSGKPVRYSLTGTWIRKLQDEGYVVRRWASCFLWWVELVKLWGGGVFKFTILVRGSLSGYVPAKRPYSYFVGLSAQSIKKSTPESPQYNIRNWYQNLDVRYRKGIFSHNVSCVSDDEATQYIKSPFIPLPGLGSFILFLFQGICLMGISGLNLLVGRQATAILLSEAIMAAYMRLVRKEDMAADYFFHHTYWLHRPLWTYEAEKKGANPYLYFYSTNCERFKRSDGYPEYDISCWHKMRWRNLFVWDSYQEEFVKKHLGNQVNCISTGAIYFTDSEANSSNIPDNCITVFDVQPFRESLYQPMCEPLEYYVYGTANSFLHDINSVVSKSQHKIVFKRKRNIGNKVDKRYKFYLEKIEKESTVFQMVDPDIHAIKLIEKSKAVVSMPFTSTSILAKEMKKPTVFYDPLNMLCKDDIGSHGIEILSSREELAAWINNLDK